MFAAGGLEDVLEQLHLIDQVRRHVGGLEGGRRVAWQRRSVRRHVGGLEDGKVARIDVVSVRRHGPAPDRAAREDQDVCSAMPGTFSRIQAVPEERSTVQFENEALCKAQGDEAGCLGVGVAATDEREWARPALFSAPWEQGGGKKGRPPRRSSESCSTKRRTSGGGDRTRRPSRHPHDAG